MFAFFSGPLPWLILAGPSFAALQKAAPLAIPDPEDRLSSSGRLPRGRGLGAS
jgi:hypothetical protein